MLTESFLTYIRCELNLSAHTVSSYSRDISEFGRFITGDNPDNIFDPLTVTASDIRLWVAALTRRGLTRRTIRKKLSALSSLFRYLTRIGRMSANPVADIARARLPKTLPVFVRQEEMAEIIDDAPVAAADVPAPFEEVRNALIVLMLYSTGMRRAELIGLRDADVDPDKGELKVLGKRNKERIIPFGDELADGIRRYRDAPVPTGGRCIRCLSNGWYAMPCRGTPTPRACRRTPCATVSPPTCLTTAPTSGPCRNCWGMPRWPRRRSTPI